MEELLSAEPEASSQSYSQSYLASSRKCASPTHPLRLIPFPVLLRSGRRRAGGQGAAAGEGEGEGEEEQTSTFSSRFLSGAVESFVPKS